MSQEAAQFVFLKGLFYLYFRQLIYISSVPHCHFTWLKFQISAKADLLLSFNSPQNPPR